MAGCCGGGNELATVGAAGNAEKVRDEVRTRYAEAARQAAAGGSASCCGGEGECSDPITGGLYADGELGTLPGGAVAASLGCGNPNALIDLTPGDVVLDLGSGGGIDVLLTARRVGPTGKAYGLDMTDEMLELARRNQAEAGIENAEFIKGRIEEVPLPSGSVDVVMSNCVINLSPEKERVLGEAYRVLRPGGRLAISDIVFRAPPPEGLRDVMALWAGCIAGALTEAEYRERLSEAGFVDVEIEITREYGPELRESYPGLFEGVGEDADGACAAFIRGRKP